jgi:hypothetical protein
LWQNITSNDDEERGHGSKTKYYRDQRDQAQERGERMTVGTGWKLAATKGKKRVFNGTLIDTVNKGDIRIAIFSVPK